MSRKKVKKETVKRKTSIYDPMGVYGRGLTENQRLGMTTQMKIENMAIPKPVITKKLLGEYGQILDFYGMYPEKSTGTNITKMIMEVPLTGYSLSINNDTVLGFLDRQGITPGVFYCDSFTIVKDPDAGQWDTDLGYHIAVGNSVYNAASRESTTMSPQTSDYVTIPAYWMNLEAIHYFKMVFDQTELAVTIAQSYEDLSHVAAYADFTRHLPQDGTEIPYLLYPNTVFPELFFGVHSISSIGDGYKIRVNLVVMY